MNTPSTNILNFSVKNLRWRKSRTEIENLYILVWILVDRRLPPRPRQSTAEAKIIAEVQTKSVSLTIFSRLRCSSQARDRRCSYHYNVISRLVVINSNFLKIQSENPGTEAKIQQIRNQRFWSDSFLHNEWCCYIQVLSDVRFLLTHKLQSDDLKAVRQSDVGMGCNFDLYIMELLWKLAPN